MFLPLNVWIGVIFALSRALLQIPRAEILAFVADALSLSDPKGSPTSSKLLVTEEASSLRARARIRARAGSTSAQLFIPKCPVSHEQVPQCGKVPGKSLTIHFLR